MMQQDRLNFDFFRKKSHTKTTEFKEYLKPFFMVCTIFTVIFGGMYALDTLVENKINSASKETVDFVEANQSSKELKEKNIQLNYANTAVMRVQKEKNLTLSFNKPLQRTDRIQSLLTELKSRGFEVLEMKDIINLDTGNKETHLIIKNET